MAEPESDDKTSVRRLRWNDLDLDLGLHLATGKPGSGKTALCFSVADKRHEETGKPCYLALEERKVEWFGMPDYWHNLPEPKSELDYPLDSIVLVDDAHRHIHARRFSSDVNVYLDKLHAQCRHDDIDFIYDTQIFGAIDRNVIERAEYVWLKRQHRRSVEFTRSETKELVEKANLALEAQPITTAYLDSDEFVGLITDIPLPDYWSDELSTMHRRPGPRKAVLRR